MTETILMEEMTWLEIREAIEAGIDTVLVPLSSIEQHGPHLPTITDTALGYELGSRIAKKLGNTLVAPPIYPGCSAHHMHFPGTVTVTKETFKALIRDYCQSLARHGFEKIALVPTHGGNYEPLSEVLPELQEALPEVKIVVIERHDSLEIRAHLNTKLGIDPKVGGSHAGLTETSLMLVTRPELVRMEWAEKGWLGKFDAAYRAKLRSQGTHALSEVGILGDPREATRELGETLLDRRSMAIADKIKEKLAEPK